MTGHPANAIGTAAFLPLLLAASTALADASRGDQPASQARSEIRNLSAGNDTFGITKGDVRTFLTSRYMYEPLPSATSRELSLDGRFAVGIRDDLSGVVGMAYTGNRVKVERDIPELGLQAGDGETTTGFRGMDLGLQYNWLSELGLRPNAAVGLTVSVPGDRPAEPGVPGQATTGDGHYRLTVSLDLAKNFYATSLHGSLDVTHVRPRDTAAGTTIDPGPSIGLRGGVSFSINAYVTLNGGWSVSWFGRSRVEGDAVEGSDRDHIAVNTGVTLRVAENTYFRQGMDFGVAGTDTATLGLTLIHLH